MGERPGLHVAMEAKEWIIQMLRLDIGESKRVQIISFTYPENATQRANCPLPKRRVTPISSEPNAPVQSLGKIG